MPTPNRRASSHRRPAEIVLAAHSYFWICWNRTPTAFPRTVWESPSSRRRARSRAPIWQSMSVVIPRQSLAVGKVACREGFISKVLGRGSCANHRRDRLSDFRPFERFRDPVAAGHAARGKVGLFGGGDVEHRQRRVQAPRRLGDLPPRHRAMQVDVRDKRADLLAMTLEKTAGVRA